MNDLSTSLADNLETAQHLFRQSPDLVIRPFQLKSGQRALLLYFEGLVDKLSITHDVLRPLITETETINELSNAPITVGRVHTVSDWPQIEMSLYTGKSALIVDGIAEALIMYTQGWPQRAISEPQTESTIKGAHQGFVETGEQNIALIRRYLPSHELKLNPFIIGKRVRSTITLLYLSDIVQPDLVSEMERRLQSIDVDAVLSTGELTEYLDDHPFNLLPQFQTTERPDAAVAHLLQGRIALVIDHSPSVLVGPVTFVSFFQAVDDYSHRWLVASFLRALRFVALLITIFLPAFYISLIAFHFEVLPFKLLLSIGESRARVPFPPIIEAFLMEISIEMLREAGLRLPGPVGQTIGVVGGIVIGQAAVQAGIVSNIMVIIVALTAISSFIIPDYDMASSLRLIRFPFMIAASLFGLIGIVIGMLLLVGVIMSMRTLNIPYGIPVAPIDIRDWKDIFVRLPLFMLKLRPRSTNASQLRRQGRNRSGGRGGNGA
ncbi:spore germination protein [Paenibacillus sp. BK720]|uniref:spore germination protein n=1 Tax=Paenibacillus sp. BK720 TaxID=2587092 RepID=UPI001420F3F5|nr:spore germination protein [Paenibacillus sp. BK720]NIK70499.1 spore germination protein [Paenibacillus sp. BK720]